MDKAIVVSTWSGGEKWANQCLMSLVGTPYPVVVVINDALNSPQKWVDHLQKHCSVVPIVTDSYEMGAIQTIYNKLPWIKEFWLLQDSIVIKNIDIFTVTFEEMAGKSVSYAPNTFECYLGKWRRDILDHLQPLPQVHNKKEAIHWEHEFAAHYFRYEGFDIPCLDWTFMSENPNNRIVEVLGEKRLLQVGAYIDKYKGITRESGNIPKEWSDKEYETFINSWTPPSLEVFKKNG